MSALQPPGRTQFSFGHSQYLPVGYIPNQLEDAFLREIKVLEARQPLEALVIPKRQGLTRLQGL